MMDNKNTPPGGMKPAQSPDMSDHLVRLANLEAFRIAQKWNKSELGRRLGKRPSQVGSWYKTRNIGEELAREIEHKLGMARYELDERPSTPDLRGVTADRSKPTLGALIPVKTRSKEVPVLAWADIHNMLNAENAALKQKAVHLETFAVCSTRAKFLLMPDDSMAPVVAPGDHLLFDPTEAPRAGDTVLVSLPSGEHFARLFRPRTAYVFEAMPHNAAYQPLTSADDGAVVVGVMVEHRSYRRPA